MRCANDRGCLFVPSNVSRIAIFDPVLHLKKKMYRSGFLIYCEDSHEVKKR